LKGNHIRMKLKIFLLLLLIVKTLNASENIKIVPPQSQFDASHSYFQSLLEMTLKVEKSNTQIIHSYQMEQGRALVQLKLNKGIDVYWAGTSMKREKEFNAIRIPLLKGLLGYRVLVINKKNIKLFENIKNIDELKKLKACQGRHWPDTLILEGSKFNVIKNSSYEAMFLQVLKGRCDYFPRGIHEGYSEIKVRELQYEELMIFDKLIVYYPFPMYFFVSKENTELAEKIRYGLNKLIDNGTFENHLKQHEITKHLFPMQNLSKSKIFEIHNPLLSKSTDFLDERLWVIPSSVKNKGNSAEVKRAKQIDTYIHE